MKFVDEAKLKVQAGNGGRGCVSFRREKFVPFGGPDGGDGGLGGSVYLKAVEGMNTLADFRISRTYRGQNGESGSGNDCTGHGGDDTYVSIPIGTVVIDKFHDAFYKKLRGRGCPAPFDSMARLMPARMRYFRMTLT